MLLYSKIHAMGTFLNKENRSRYVATPDRDLDCEYLKSGGYVDAQRRTKVLDHSDRPVYPNFPLLQLGEVIRLTFGRAPRRLLHDGQSAHVGRFHALAVGDGTAWDGVFDEHGGMVGLSQDRESAILRRADAHGPPLDDIARAETVVSTAPPAHAGLAAKEQMPVRARRAQNRRVAGPNERAGVAERLVRDVPALAAGDGTTRRGGALGERCHGCAVCLCRSS